ncbi:hypothetical protein [Cognatiyoonia sp. IB215182]|uniref:hypothetical protein n=1 Tax=Cognatiyoonia sp. IB215182 TaxID=3097353 RepID=UPI002A1862CA|nr:hypothetical protein [Cognatiyoonia sp. IB215182]MDX8352199.1 hypothetical protein [Cognatiyoonia sp. IB215182]
MTHFTKLTSATAIACVVATPIFAQERDPQPTLGEFFSPDRIATALANSAITALRTRMELQYDHLSADPMRGVVSVSGIVARPLLPYDQARQCEITIERATLSSDLATPFEAVAELNLNLIGTQINLACLEREIALPLRTAGLRELSLDQFKVSANYAYTTGETTLDGSIAVNGFGALDYSGSGTILPRLGEFGYPGDPAVRVSRAVVTLKDDGGWAAISQVLPENLRDPLTIRELGTEAISQYLSDGGLRPLGAVERNFIRDLMDEVEDFVTETGEITIEADLPPSGVVIEPDMYAAPQTLIAALGLQARSTPLVRTEILSVADLAEIQSPDNLSPTQRITLATALLEGNGVPRGAALVPDLLMSLLDDPEVAGEAAALLAQATQDRDIPAAYGYALIAAAADMPNATAQLDRLELQMTTQAVLAAQDSYLKQTGAPAPISRVSGSDPRDLRRLALAHFAGVGETRSYARAYYYALLAEAAGDIAATTLREEIAARFGARGPDVAQVWSDIAADMQQLAITDWINADLPAVYLTTN